MDERIKKLQNGLDEKTAILVLGNINRQYLTGFKSSAGAVVVTKSAASLFIDFRYFEIASKQVRHLEVKLTRDTYSDIYELLKCEQVENLLIETNIISIDRLKKIKESMPDINVSQDDSLSDTIVKMRSIKTEKEISYITEAQKLTDEAFSHILNFIKAGVTEIEVALELEFFMRKKGSEGTAFDFIVVSGKNSSLPHGEPTQKQINNGDFVTMDFGGVCNGYRSDMTRTVAVGFATDKQQMIYETVLSAQSASLNIIKDGVNSFEVDKAARDIITNAGFGNNFGHGLGHSVGLQTHEWPSCNTREETTLKTGMIMTVEPGIYLPDEFGVRIEDMVAVTDNGYSNFTKSPKNLIIL